jgi:hypothetical protein
MFPGFGISDVLDAERPPRTVKDGGLHGAVEPGSMYRRSTRLAVIASAARQS